MRIAFDAEWITERGTSVATYDYAVGAVASGMEAAIFYRKDAEHQIGALNRFRDRFEMIGYASHADLAAEVRAARADIYYKLKPVYEDMATVPGVLNAVQCAFDFDRPHGDVYGYVSEWLSRHVSGGRRPFVPHIVQLPTPQADLRRAWGIPAEALVVGRYGGETTFDIGFAQRAVAAIVEERADIWFVFVNTKPFARHPRILFRDVLVSPQEKADYIESCDVMLHARLIGETFGLAIAEFAYGGKPFLCWRGGRDRHHLWLQTNGAFIYSDGPDLMAKLRSLSRQGCRDAGSPLRRFTADAVMPIFRSAYLSGPNARSTAPTTLPYRIRRKALNYARRTLDARLLRQA